MSKIEKIYKKKILLFGTLFLLICGLSFFSIMIKKGKNRVSVTDNFGNAVKITYKELVELENNNEAKFEKNYNKASIEFTSTIKKITKGQGNCKTMLEGTCWTITFSNDWDVLLLENEDPHMFDGQKYITYGYTISDYEIGDKIKVQGKIQNIYQKIFVQNVSEERKNNIVTRTDSTTFEKIN